MENFMMEAFKNKRTWTFGTGLCMHVAYLYRLSLEQVSLNVIALSRLVCMYSY